MSEPKTYKVRGEATSFEPKTARFEGEITVWFEEQPPVEPPPQEPVGPASRLAQYSVGAGAYQYIERLTDYASVATYGYTAQAADVLQPGWLVQTCPKYYGTQALQSQVVYEQAVNAGIAYYGMAAKSADVAYEHDVCGCREWPGTFNGRAFRRCTWNNDVFGARRVRAQTSTWRRRWQ